MSPYLGVLPLVFSALRAPPSLLARRRGGRRGRLCEHRGPGCTSLRVLHAWPPARAPEGKCSGTSLPRVQAESGDVARESRRPHARTLRAVQVTGRKAMKLNGGRTGTAPSRRPGSGPCSPGTWPGWSASLRAGRPRSARASAARHMRVSAGGAARVLSGGTLPAMSCPHRLGARSQVRLLRHVWRGGGDAPACEMSRAPTISPMSADRLGAIACILSSRYACSCRRYSASEMTRRANVSMLIMSIGLMSWPMDVLAASRISRARSSSPVISVSSARRARARALRRRRARRARPTCSARRPRPDRRHARSCLLHSSDVSGTEDCTATAEPDTMASGPRVAVRHPSH